MPEFHDDNNFKFIWTKHGVTFQWKVEESSTTFIQYETDIVGHGIRY